jgi:uncharacterized protein YbaP (TraB family)
MIFIFRTYKVFYVVVLFVLSSYAATAQEYKKIPGDTTLEKALLWKISRSDLPQDSYLYGTLHIICTNYVDTPFVLTNALNSCKKLVLEITDSGLPISTYTTPIKDLVGKWYFKEIKKAITAVYPAEPDTGKKYRLPPRAYVDIMLGGERNCQITSLENILILLAGNEIPQGGLETNRDRDSLELFAKLSLKQQAWRLEDFIDNMEPNKRLWEKTLTYYKQHDINNLYVISNYLFSFKGFPIQSDFSKTLLAQRNKLWIPRMEQIMKEGPIFFAVGCSHLAGGYGVISLLRQKGYTLTPLF